MEKSGQLLAKLFFQQDFQQIGCLHPSLSGKRVKSLDEFHIQPGLDLPLMIGALVGHTRYALLNPVAQTPDSGIQSGRQSARE